MIEVELRWPGKSDEIEIDPHVLVKDSDGGYGELSSDNKLIYGDNLLAIQALEAEYAGKVKCVYIDPPYNIRKNRTHYRDKASHSEWLSFMQARIAALRPLLCDDGTMWISIDDNESHYLKVVCDEIFGRKNFISNIIWERNYAPAAGVKWFCKMHENILVYGKDKGKGKSNLLPRTAKMDSDYRSDDGDGRGLHRRISITSSPASFSKASVYPIVNPDTGETYFPPNRGCWCMSKATAEHLISTNQMYFGKGAIRPQKKYYLSEAKQGLSPRTIWFHKDVGESHEANRESKLLFNEAVFSNSKPERLLQRILTLATNPGDIILDAFLGSGTTAAVAHKMGREYIGIESGEQLYTHCVSRLKKVIDGDDGLKLSKELGWEGGGGFKLYTLM